MSHTLKKLFPMRLNMLSKIGVFTLIIMWSFIGQSQISRVYATITASSTTITTSGYITVTVSANACETSFAAWGAGGGGATGATNQGGGGGGGGGFASSTVTTTPGDTIRIYVAPSTALEVSGATTTASTTAPVLIVGASGGRALLAAVGAEGGLGSLGDVTNNGGSGGSATTGTGDESGGGGGAGGPHGVGGNGGSCTSSTVGCGGGASNSGGSGTNNTVTAGTAVAGTSGANGGTGDNGTTPDTVGGNGTYGGGGGGGADDGRAGSDGGAPGGGGGGGEAGGGGGGAGQLIITEFINDAGCVVVPTITTVAAGGVGVSSATLNGTVTSDGGDPADTVGFAFSTDSTLTTGVATTTETGTFATSATFDEFIQTLKAGITYYFRAYAINSVGTGIASNILNFTAGTDFVPTRKIRLFEGSTIKFYEGTIKLYGN